MRLLRFGICALSCLPLRPGGVEDWAQAVLETGTGLLFLAWPVIYFTRKNRCFSPLLRPGTLLPSSLRPVAFSWHYVFYSTRMDLLLLVSDLILLFSRCSFPHA